MFEEEERVWIMWMITDKIYLGNSTDGKRNENPVEINGVFRILERKHTTFNAAFDLPINSDIHIGFKDSGCNEIWKIQLAIGALVTASLISSKPILVYCHEGRSRSVGIIASYLTSHMGVTLDEAIEFIRNIRSDINVNEGWKNNLLEAIDG